MHAALTFVAIVGLIAFAFGEKTARMVTAIGLLAGLAFFLYIFYRVAMGTI